MICRKSALKRQLSLLVKKRTNYPDSLSDTEQRKMMELLRYLELIMPRREKLKIIRLQSLEQSVFMRLRHALTVMRNQLLRNYFDLPRGEELTRPFDNLPVRMVTRQFLTDHDISYIYQLVGYGPKTLERMTQGNEQILNDLEEVFLLLDLQPGRAFSIEQKEVLQLFCQLCWEETPRTVQ